MHLRYRFLKLVLTFMMTLSLIFLIPYFVISLKEIVAYHNEDLLQRSFTLAFNIMLFLAEILITIYGLYFFNAGIKALDYHLKFDFEHQIHQEESKLPPVTVIIPVKDKNPEELKKTIKSLKCQDYPSSLLQVIISTNSTNPNNIKEYQQLCREHSIKYVEVPPEEKGFKARVLNEGLKHATGKYVIILDADHVVVPEMVMQFINAFLSLPKELRKKVAYIQAKATFGEIRTFYQKASNMLLAHFYEIFEKAKHGEGTVIFNGSTACFQRDALKSIGGFPMDTYTEDSDASIKLLIDGYKGFFLNKHLSYGKTPESFQDQVSQLWRWTHGAGSIFRLRTKEIIRSRHLSFYQKVDLLLSASILLAAVGSVGVPILIILMITMDIPILRPSLPFYGSLALGPASIVMLGHLITALMTIYWEPTLPTNNGEPIRLTRRLFKLFAYYMLSLASFFFIISAFIKGLLLKDDAKAAHAKWNRNMNLWPPYCLLVMITALALFSGWKVLARQLFLYYPFIALFFTFPLSLLIITLDIRH